MWYSSGFDVARQLVANEGLFAFYKGAGTHYLRLGPHMVLVRTRTPPPPEPPRASSRAHVDALCVRAALTLL